jgi:hypothetical protein
MTTVLDRAGSRPQIHAFVVGVDRYPYCGPTTRHEGRFGSAARQIPDLTCAVPSAVTTANWLLDNLVGDDFRPLGSLELLVSAAGPILFPVDEDTTEVERATFGNVRRAFELWRKRCGSNPDNVALFFFFGHGCRIQADDVLLLEDVCDAEAGFFDNAVDFGATYRAMSACAAGIQCYFIDACRDVPDYLDDLELRPRSLMTPSLHQPPRDAPASRRYTSGRTTRGPAAPLSTDTRARRPSASALVYSSSRSCRPKGTPGWSTTAVRCPSRRSCTYHPLSVSRVTVRTRRFSCFSNAVITVPISPPATAQRGVTDAPSAAHIRACRIPCPPG